MFRRVICISSTYVRTYLISRLTFRCRRSDTPAVIPSSSSSSSDCVVIPRDRSSHHLVCPPRTVTHHEATSRAQQSILTRSSSASEPKPLEALGPHLGGVRAVDVGIHHAVGEGQDEEDVGHTRVDRVHRALGGQDEPKTTRPRVTCREDCAKPGSCPGCLMCSESVILNFWSKFFLIRPSLLYSSC